ncbi:MAG: S41 family peptidase [Bacteroidia bacterium]
MKNRIKSISRKWILPVFIALTFVGGAGYTADNYFEVSKNLDIFASLIKEVNTYYVDEVDASDLVRTGIDAMLKTLDPYTNYISESEIEDYRFMTTGEYGGIGAVISTAGKDVLIVEPYDGYSAVKAGLRAGDKILEIDGKDMTGKNTQEVSALLKGQPGTVLELKILRPGNDEPFISKVTREEIKLNNVPYYGMVNEQVGYIQFRSFRQNAAKEVKSALSELKKNPGLESIILDVRGNPGGLLNEAVNTVNLFIPKGKSVVSTKGRIKEWVKDYKTMYSPVDTDIPLIVLTNGTSASASEIVSGAVQDHDRGIIIGQQTYGKGLVQTTRPLSYNAQLKITTAKYYIPSGRCIQRIDYSSRDGLGKAGKIPDSLITEYKTLGGRSVYDGCGITPDIETDVTQHAEITKTLLNKRYIFDFATKYRNTHDSIPPVKDFQLTLQDFEDFIAFISDKDYQYETNTEKALEKLKESAETEKYYEAISSDYESMLQKLKHDKEEDLRKHQEEVIALLEEEIVSRYYYRNGRIQVSLRTDTDVREALEVFENPQEFKGILTLAE